MAACPPSSLLIPLCLQWMEFPLSGGNLPGWDFRITRVVRYISSYDYVVLALEVILVVAVLERVIFTLWAYAYICSLRCLFDVKRSMWLLVRILADVFCGDLFVLRRQFISAHEQAKQR